MTDTEAYHIIAMVIYIHLAIASVAFIAALSVVMAYIRLVTDDNKLVSYFAFSHILIFGGYSVRAVYAAARPLFTPESVLESVSRSTVNIPIDILVTTASIFALKAIHSMIADEHRDQWHWYSAMFYPPWSLLSGFIRLKNCIKTRFWRAGNNEERRKKQEPISFPDRRSDED